MLQLLQNRVPHGYELSQSGIKQLSSLKTEITCRLRAQKNLLVKTDRGVGKRETLCAKPHT